MQIDVVCVCFNAARTIERTIESFHAQSHPHKRLLVVDGASTDETVALARAMGAEVVSEPDRGMYDALNKGFATLSGDAVGALNADDRYHDADCLSRIAEALGEADIVHGHLDFVAEEEPRRVVRRWRAMPRPPRGFRTGWMPAHPTFYVRREVARTVGPFDLSLPTSADYDWMLRAVELHGFSTAMIDAVLIDMMYGGRSTVSLSSYVDHNLQALRARRRWLDAGPIDYALFAKPLRKLTQFAVGGKR